MKNTCFMDFEFKTGNVTLAPRSDTEILVEKAVELFEKGDSAPFPDGKRALSPFSILDIGTGCGNIAISLTNYIPSSRIVALDISDSALYTAKENAVKYGVENRIEFIKSDLFENLRARREIFFDLVIANPPYVNFGDLASLPDGVKDEPLSALYGGRDGLDFYRRIADEAASFMKPDGILLMEIGYGQALSVRSLLKAPGRYEDIEFFKDYSGIDRIVYAKRIRQ